MLIKTISLQSITYVALVFSVAQLFISVTVYAQTTVAKDQPEQKTKWALGQENTTQAEEKEGTKSLEPLPLVPDTEVTEVESSALEEDSAKTVFNRELLTRLNTQFESLQEALKTEDTFSLRLAELYAEYGDLLIRARRYEEASDVYTQALHIRKVNFGIYSAEQLQLLNVLSKISAALNDSDKLIVYLQRAISIQNKNAEISNHVIDMALRAGHYYIDQFYKEPRSYGIRQGHLEKAKYYFDYVFTKNQGRTLKEKSLPYGELLLISHLENTLIEQMPLVYDRTFYTGSVSTIGSTSSLQALELEKEYHYLRGAYVRSVAYLKSYIQAATTQENGKEIANALLAWADNQMLFGRKLEAAKYYKLAYEQARDVFSEQELRERFTYPMQIPAYNYLHERDNEFASDKVIPVPLSFSVGADGSISNVKSLEGSEDVEKYLTRARRKVRQLNFRPAIVDGDTVAVNEFVYPVKVVVN